MDKINILQKLRKLKYIYSQLFLNDPNILLRTNAFLYSSTNALSLYWGKFGILGIFRFFKYSFFIILIIPNKFFKFHAFFFRFKKVLPQRIAV